MILEFIICHLNFYYFYTYNILTIFNSFHIYLLNNCLLYYKICLTFYTNRLNYIILMIRLIIHYYVILIFLKFILFANNLNYNN